MKIMLRMILYSIWNYEKAEARLASYEREGYRTEKAYFGRIFQLKKAEPREVQYVFLPVWPNTFAIAGLGTVFKTGNFITTATRPGRRFAGLCACSTKNLGGIWWDAIKNWMKRFQKLTEFRAAGIIFSTYSAFQWDGLLPFDCSDNGRRA